jgi:thiol-disulfide isomerase/thioredoxin
MKKTILTMAALTLLAASANAADEKGSVNFSVNLKGLKDTLIVITPTEQGMKRDTVLTKDGQFNFTVNVEKPMDIYAYTLGTLRQEERIGFSAIAVPGEKAVLTGDLNSAYYFSGSKFYEQFNEADRANDAAMKPLSDLMASLEKRMANGEKQDVVSKEYEEKAPALQKQATEAMVDFIAKHPDSEGAAAFIPRLDNIDAMKKAAASLSDNIKNGRMHDYYHGVIDEAEKQEQAEQASAKKQAAGTVAPDFTLNDLNGKPLKLSSFKGKYVLLDFWGTWCIWCVRGIPKMKEYYNKYKGKFEILSIDCNETQDKWKAGVKKYQLPWKHVYQPRTGAVQTTELYGITGFPTKILVGPDGKIVKTVVGEDPAFYTFLDETFGKK